MSSIELVLYTPLLMFVTFLVVQFALAYLANQGASAAAREAARVARVGGGTLVARQAGEAKGRAVVANVSGGLLITPRVTVNPVGTQAVEAVVTGYAQGVVPGVRFSIRQVVRGPVETFRPDQ